MNTRYTKILEVYSNASGALGPSLDLIHESPSPADSDVIGRINFYADNDAGEKTVFGRIDAVASDVSNSTEDAILKFYVMKAGTLTESFEIDSTGAIVLTGYGRIATGAVGGSALTIDSNFAYGEGIELRYTSTKSDNSQFQGMYMEVRTSIANSSTIRGMEVKAAQEGAIAVGVLEGGNFVANTRSTTTGNVTSMYGLTGEVTHNSNAYTGTITNLAAVRGKASLEDGVTYTNSSVFLAQIEAITGADVIGSILRVEVSGAMSATSLINAADLTATNFYEVDADGDGGLTIGAIPNANPESDAEDGYLKVLVGSTTYAIPIYDTSA